MIVQNAVAFKLQRFHTAAPLESGYVIVNTTLTPADGSDTLNKLSTYGIQSDLLSPELLVGPGTTDILFSSTNPLGECVLGHFTRSVNMYNASAAAIGCVREEWELVQRELSYIARHGR